MKIPQNHTFLKMKFVSNEKYVFLRGYCTYFLIQSSNGYSLSLNWVFYKAYYNNHILREQFPTDWSKRH